MCQIVVAGPTLKANDTKVLCRIRNAASLSISIIPAKIFTKKRIQVSHMVCHNLVHVSQIRGVSCILTLSWDNLKFPSCTGYLFVIEFDVMRFK